MSAAKSNPGGKEIPPFARLLIAFLISLLAFLCLIYTWNPARSLNNGLSSNVHDIHQESNGKWMSHLRSKIQEKMIAMAGLIATGTEKISISEPLQLKPIWLLFNDEDGQWNATILDLQVHGLSKLKVSDIALNTQTKDVSILLGADDVRVTATYAMTSNRNETSVSDRGKIYFKVGHWSTSCWTSIVNETSETLTVTKEAFNSYYDNFTGGFYTSQRNPVSTFHQKLLLTLQPLVLQKVREDVDHRLRLLFSHIFAVLTLEPKEPDSLMDLIEAQSQKNGLREKRQVPCSKGKELDEYVDSLFRFASRLVRAMEPIGLPNATIDLPEYNLKLFLHSGGASRAYTLSRKRPAWVHCSNESVSLGLTVGFEELRVKYKFRAILDWNLLFDGELEAMLRDTKLQVQFTQTTPEEDSEEQVQQRVDRLRIWRLGHIRVIVRGLGNIGQAVSMLLTNMVNQQSEDLMPTIRNVETIAVDMINVLLKNISIPFFSII